MIIQSTSTRPILTVQRSIPLVPSLARITIKNPRSKRERLRTGAGKLPIFRFCLEDEDRFFNLSNIRSTPSSNDTVKIESDSKRDSKVDHQSYWVGIPPDAVDKSLTRKLKRVEGVHQRVKNHPYFINAYIYIIRMELDRSDPVEVKEGWEKIQLSIITERWVRDGVECDGDNTIGDDTGEC
ncbi:hypothetical protein BY996DRAFT_8218001 [Phakopsora pachyrhizi]|nr:hypothetical protein BY996DRAFT_8218001 [Phakopsora pachyrhizi]